MTPPSRDEMRMPEKRGRRQFGQPNKRDLKKHEKTWKIFFARFDTVETSRAYRSLQLLRSNSLVERSSLEWGHRSADANANNENHLESVLTCGTIKNRFDID